MNKLTKLQFDNAISEKNKLLKELEKVTKFINLYKWQCQIDQDYLDSIYKTTIREWEHFKTCSTRLNNVLRAHSDELKYIEDVTKDSFQKCRNGGKVCWNEFHKLRGY